MLRETVPTLLEWHRAGHRFAIATVTQTRGSSPRPVGSVMGIREDGLILGSVSGGCVEGGVIQVALDSLAQSECRELIFEELSDDSLWDVGLSCGGAIQVFIQPDPISKQPDVWLALEEEIRQERKTALLVRLADGHCELADGSATQLPLQLPEEIDWKGQRWFANVVHPREKLIVVGSVHISVPLVKFAKDVGFETIVIDPRSAFANPDRFQVPPDQLIVSWPEEALSQIVLSEMTYLAVLTHDPKLDDAAINIALRSNVRYIGALGSRVTQAKRKEALRALGHSDESLERIHGPIGLNIGAKSPEEIALSIIAEMVQVRRASA